LIGDAIGLEVLFLCFERDWNCLEESTLWMEVIEGFGSLAAIFFFVREDVRFSVGHAVLHDEPLELATSTDSRSGEIGAFGKRDKSSVSPSGNLR